MNSDLSLIWNELSSSSIGFYTYNNADDIPEGPGVYAWFYPLNLKFKEDLISQLTKIRKIQSYDVKEKRELNISESFNINWDPLKVTLEKDIENIKLDSQLLKHGTP